MQLIKQMLLDQQCQRRKKLSNLKFSYHTSYYTNESIWRAEDINSQVNTGISDVVIFNSNEVSLVKISAPLNSGLEDIIYYGNVEKIVNISRYDDVVSPIEYQSKRHGYPIIVSGANTPGSTDKKVFENGTTLNHINAATTTYTGTDSVKINYKSSPHAVVALNYTSVVHKEYYLQFMIGIFLSLLVNGELILHQLTMLDLFGEIQQGVLVKIY